MNDKAGKLGWVALGVVLGATASLSVVSFAAAPATAPSSDALGTIGAAMTAIYSRFALPVEEGRVVEGCVAGMVQRVDSRGSYISPEELKAQSGSALDGGAGIGLELNMPDQRLTVVSPLDDTPASRAGLRAGDVITHIDGRTTADISLSEAVKLLRGEPGSTTKLVVERKGQEPLPMSIAREIIRVRSVRGANLNDGYGYVRIAQFNATTSRDLLAQVRTLRAKGLSKGLILDLRSNPGGLLEEAQQAASFFLPQGARISSMTGRAEGSQQTVEAGNVRKGGPDLDGGARMLGLDKMPVVVLINRGTAAGSEIIAAALQDNRRARIVGTRSFGMAGVQILVPLPNEGAMKLTYAYWVSPNGNDIQDVGVKPDLEIADEAKIEFGAANDSMLQRAMTLLKAAS